MEEKNTEKGSSNKENNKSGINKQKLGQYKDPIGKISLKKLKTGLWFVENKPVFKKTLIGLLLIVTIGLWIYFLVSFGWYIFQGMEQDEKMINQMTKENFTPGVELPEKFGHQLKFSSVNVFRHKNKYDMYIKIQNPSEHYTANFDYCFTRGEEKIDCKQDFIYPEQSKYVLSLSQELSNPNNIQFRINNTDWEKIDYHEIQDWNRFKQEHLNFQFKNIKYKSSSKNNYSDKVDLNTLNFKAINDSAYSYWKVDLNIILYNAGRIVGVNKYSLNNFMSGKERDVELVWSANMGRVTDVSIIPNVNILDENVYIKPEG